MVCARKKSPPFCAIMTYEKQPLFCKILPHGRVTSSTPPCTQPLVQFPPADLVKLRVSLLSSSLETISICMKRTFTEERTYENIRTRYVRTPNYNKKDVETSGVIAIGCRQGYALLCCSRCRNVQFQWIV